jgi:YVTN family beta-propeller protein
VNINARPGTWMLTLLSEEIEMLKLRVAAMVKRGEQGRARRSRLTVRVRQAGLAAVAIASLGLAGAAALAGTTAHSGTAGATPGVLAQAGAAADRIPATRPGTATVYVVNAHSDTVTPIAIANNRAGPAIKVGDNPQAIAISPDGKTAYVANYVSGTVTPISTATSKPGPAIKAGFAPA